MKTLALHGSRNQLNSWSDMVRFAKLEMLTIDANLLPAISQVEYRPPTEAPTIPVSNVHLLLGEQMNLDEAAVAKIENLFNRENHRNFTFWLENVKLSGIETAARNEQLRLLRKETLWSRVVDSGRQ